MQEYLHYDNPANGLLHVIIPSKLIAFQRPSSAPVSNGRWADVDGKRLLSPAFFAEILYGDFEVELVVRCETFDPELASNELDGTSRGGYDDGAFEEWGVAVEWLSAGGAEGAAGLRDMDRFLTLARLAPGTIAIHGGEGAALGRGGELLVVSLLVSRYGFDAAAALAWLRIAHPPAPPSSLVFSLLPPPPPKAAPPARAARRGWHAAGAFSRSAPELLPCGGPG